MPPNPRLMMKATILLDPGHGIDTPGKRSPGCDQGATPSLREWEFTRDLAAAIAHHAEQSPVIYHAEILVHEDNDIGLTARARRANAYIKAHPGERCILYSIHGNAAGNGTRWMESTGWEAWTTLGSNNSDKLATLLYEAVRELLPQVRLRKDMTDGDPDKEKNFTVLLGANCPAVLTENLFYDSRKDIELMTNDTIMQLLAKAHVIAAERYFSQL